MAKPRFNDPIEPMDLANMRQDGSTISRLLATLGNWGDATARLRCRMLWNAAVVLTIIIAFGGALFALATDLPRRPSDRA
jgi:hypothetical protein